MEIPAHTRIEPPPNCWVSRTQLSRALSPVRRYTRRRPSLPLSFILVSSINKTLAQSARVNLKWRIAQAKRAARCRGRRTGTLIGRRARIPASRRRLMIVSSLTGRLWMPIVRLAVDAAVIRLSRKWDNTIYLSCRLVVTLRRGRRRRFATVPVWLNFAHNFSMALLLLFKVLATLKK